MIKRERMIAMALCAMLAVNLLPSAVFAQDNAEEPQTQENAETEPKTEQEPETEGETEAENVCTVSFILGDETVTEQVTEGQVPTLPSGSSNVTHWMVTGSAVVVRPETIPVTEDVSYTAWTAPKLISDHNQYVSGTGTNQFSPDRSITHAEAAKMLYDLLADKTRGSYDYHFKDVYYGKWYYRAVTGLASLGLINAGGYFRPDAVMTRSEFVELVTRLVPYTTKKVTFTDVDDSDPNAAAIATAAAKGWVSGYSDGSFSGDDALTRAQAVVIFNHILNRTGDAKTEALMDSRYTFKDVPSSHWAYKDIMEAATTHAFTRKGSGESWSTYTHKVSGTVNWEDASSVVAAASITNTISSTYSGAYDHSYNWDYSAKTAENYINGKGYSSDTSYLLWVSLQNQKVYCFTGSKGKWKLTRTMLCGSGAPGHSTPTGVTKITYRQDAWDYTSYVVYKPVRFYPNSGYAFHSRLHYHGEGYYDASIGFPCSHGCVRMLDDDLNFIYRSIPDSTTVVIY